MQRTIVIRRDYLHYLKKYNRFEKRHKTLSVHCSPAFRIKVGDVVTVGQCRPLSKTIRFNVIRKEVQHVEGNVRKVFVLFWAVSPTICFCMKLWARLRVFKSKVQLARLGSKYSHTASIKICVQMQGLNHLLKDLNTLLLLSITHLIIS